MDQWKGDCSKDEGVLKSRNEKKGWWRNKSVEVYDLKKIDREVFIRKKFL